MKRPYNVIYHLERYDRYCWWSPKLKKWGQIDNEDDPHFIKPPFKSWCVRHTIKGAIRMAKTLPKGSTILRITWKHGARIMDVFET